jgi:hypothetical protein
VTRQGEPNPDGGEQELLISPMMYRVLGTVDGKLAIEVVVGSYAMSSVRVQLNEQEAAEYAKKGHAATDELAQRIMEDPGFFGRAVPVP